MAKGEMDALPSHCFWALPSGYTQELWGRLELKAIDYRTGRLRWSHLYLSDVMDVAPGILTTAGNLFLPGTLRAISWHSVLEMAGFCGMRGWARG